MQYILCDRLKPWLKLFFVFFAVLMCSCDTIKRHPKINYSQFKDLLVQNQVVQLEVKAGEVTVELREGTEVTLLGQGPEQIRTDLTVVSVRMPQARDKDLQQQLQSRQIKFVEHQSPSMLKSLLPLWMTVIFIGFLIVVTFLIVLRKFDWTESLETGLRKQSTIQVNE